MSRRLPTLETLSLPADVLAGLYTRLDQFVSRSDEGCWEWLGAALASGYGQIGIAGDLPDTRRNFLAHRVMYERLVGPIGPELTLDHLCRNRRCVRPSHLEPVPLAENIRRARTATCKRGHQRIEGERQCAECLRYVVHRRVTTDEFRARHRLYERERRMRSMWSDAT